jgi:hypothetical protein
MLSARKHQLSGGQGARKLPRLTRNPIAIYRHEEVADINRGPQTDRVKRRGLNRGPSRAQKRQTQKQEERCEK